MTSTGVNVLRYTALGVGVFYGFLHQMTITRTKRAEAAKNEYEHKVDLIKKAKTEYASLKKTPPEQSGVITDPMDPKFDLDVYFTNLVKQNP